MKTNKKNGNPKDFRKTRKSTKDYKGKEAYGTTGTKYDNDVSWYTKYPSLVAANSSIIFNHRYGKEYDVLPNIPLASGITLTNNNSICGVVGLEFRPTLGGDGSELDPVNVCAKNLYTYTRHANSGSANYESSDQMQYVVTILGLATRLEQLKRDLRLVMTYNPLNRYVFQSILLTRGYTQAAINDMVQNNALYVGALNAVVAQFNTFKIPRDFAIFDKFSWMVTNVFKDDALDKASYYFYFTRDLVHYDWANRKVTFTQDTVGTFAQELAKIQTEINNLLNYEDIGIMIGDILKAWKQEGCRVWSPMQIGEIQDASATDEVMLQINNTTSYGITGVLTLEQINANTQLLGMKQGTGTYGVLTAQVSDGGVISILSGNATFNPELVEFENQPSSASIIISTRNTIGCTIAQDLSNLKATLKYYPSTVITKIRVGYFNANTYTLLDTQTVMAVTSSTDVADKNVISKGYSISHYPTLYRINEAGANKYAVNVYAYGKNNLVVSNDWLKALHDGCKMSEFSLPMFKLLESN